MTEDWIDVKDALPLRGVDVLVVRYDSTMSVGHIVVHEGHRVGDWARFVSPGWSGGSVVANTRWWKPLPDAPPLQSSRPPLNYWSVYD